MKTETHLKEAFESAGSPVALLHTEGRQEIFDRLGGAFTDLRLDAGSPAVDHFAWAIFNRDASLEDRRQHANQAINDGKERLFDALPQSVGGVDIGLVKQRSEKLASDFIEGIVGFAEATTDPDSKGLDGFKEKLAFLYPEEKSAENVAVVGITMLNVLQPYLVDRILELDIYDPSELKEQIQQIRNDCQLIASFQQSASSFMEFTTTGRRTLSDSEMADKLFGIGPLFAQLGQSLSANAERVDKTQEVSETVANIAKAFQEGIAMPDARQLLLLEEGLPEGLSLEQVFSSAKIAYVARTASADGAEYATKIKRPGIEKALQANVRTFIILARIAQSYLEAHGLDALAEKQHRLLKDFLPLVLDDIKDDMRGEMDFDRERRLQRVGGAVLGGHAGVVVPKIEERLSDKNHLTMELIPGERIENMPAHPDYLTNVMILLLEGRRQKFLHGDMHAGNIKALKDDSLGRIVAYDWGKSLELPKGFERSVVQLMVGVMRRNPKAMAKAYRRVANGNLSAVAQEEIEHAATDAVDAFMRANEEMPDQQRKKQDEMSRAERQAAEASGILMRFTTNMMKEHQAGIKVEYITYMKSMVSLTTIVKAELAKPEYTDKKYRNRTILTSAVRAIREVYGRSPRRSRRGKNSKRDNNNSKAN